MLFSRYYPEPKAVEIWDGYSILLVAFTAIFLISGIVACILPSSPLQKPAPHPIEAPVVVTILHRQAPPLPPKDITTLKALMRRVGLKLKFSSSSSPNPPHSVADMFDELLSLCPTHLKSWLVDFVDACPTLPPTYSELVDLIMDSIKESISPDVAWSSLLAHKQGSLSVADYAERFRLLAETAKASEDVQSILFRQGLSQATQQPLLAVPPS